MSERIGVASTMIEKALETMGVAKNLLFGAALMLRRDGETDKANVVATAEQKLGTYCARQGNALSCVLQDLVQMEAKHGTKEEPAATPAPETAGSTGMGRKRAGQS